MSNWELAWIIAGCAVYLWIGGALQMVIFMDEAPNPRWTAPLQRLGITLLWPLGVLLPLIGMFFAD